MKKQNLILLILLVNCISVFGQDREALTFPIDAWVANNQSDSSYILKHITKHSFISIEEFEKKEVIFSLHYDPAEPNVKVSDSNIEIICRDDTISFTDMEEDEYGYYSLFTYLGQFTTNSSYSPYLIKVNFSEYTGFSLVDNVTGGDEVMHFGQPVMSPDTGLFAEFWSEPYDSQSYLSIYKIHDRGLKTIIYITYPLEYCHQDLYWGKDGNIYISILSRDKYNSSWELVEYLKVEIDWSAIDLSID